MTSTIHIESVKPSKSGKSLVITSGGSYYSAKLDSGLLGKQGQTIEAETEASDYQGKTMVWINKWKLGQDGPPPFAPNAGSAAPQQNGSTGNNVAPWWGPMCSNVLAHAIQVGVIRTPDDLAPWATAVKTWAEGGTAEPPIPF